MAGLLGEHMFITKKHHFPQNGAEGRRSELGVAVSGRHGARRHGSGPNRRRAQAADGLLLPSPRRDHGQHVAWPGHGSDGRPAVPGADFKLSPILSSLEPYKKYVSSFGNLENAATAGSVHTLHSGDVAQRHASGHRRSPSAHMATTLDQVIAKVISQDTPLPSLEVSSETIVQVAAGGGGSYTTLSFRDAESPLPMESNPRKVFLQLFGEGDTPQERASISHQTNSILDLILDRTKKLQGELGSSDRAVLDGYLESVREIERRTQMAGAKDLSGLKIPDAPIGELDDFRRTGEVDVRPDRAGLSGRPHPRGFLHHGRGRHQPDLQPHRSSGFLPPRIAPRQRSGTESTSWSRSRPGTWRSSRNFSPRWRRRRTARERCSTTRSSCTGRT